MRTMSHDREEKKEEISAKYVTKIFQEESIISGFLHKRIVRIRDLMKAWRSEKENSGKDSPGDDNLKR